MPFGSSASIVLLTVSPCCYADIEQHRPRQGRCGRMLHSKQRMYIALAAGSSALLILGLSVHLMSLRADYWALAEGHPSRLSDEGADMKLLFVGNSFIHYNGGAEAVSGGAGQASCKCSLLPCTSPRHALSSVRTFHGRA